MLSRILQKNISNVVQLPINDFIAGDCSEHLQKGYSGEQLPLIFWFLSNRM